MAFGRALCPLSFYSARMNGAAFRKDWVESGYVKRLIDQLNAGTELNRF